MKKLATTLIAILFVITAIGQTHPPLGGGNGTPETPYLINTPSHLADLANFVNSGYSGTANKHYKLTSDIDLSTYYNWSPIGGTGTKDAFRGILNGNEHKISNLTITGNETHRGLFGQIMGATISNLAIVDCNITGSTMIGGLVGEVTNTTTTLISNCYVTGNITGTGNNVGGLVGNYNSGGSHTITNCYITANVSGNQYVGGLVGYIKGSIKYSYATGTIKGSGSAIGGIAGGYYNEIDPGAPEIRNCFAANDSIINATSGSSSIGRIVGWCDVTTNVSNNYALNTIIVKNANGIVNITDGQPRQGTAKPLATLQTLSFYTTPTNWANSPWSITNPSGVWKICDTETLPFLRYENIECTPPFVPVTSITLTSSNTTFPNTPLTLTTTIQPTDATNQTIVWSVVSPNPTGATIINSIFTATSTGVATIKATIANGLTPTTPYEQTFTITVQPIPVTNITLANTNTITNIPLTLSATVSPTNATNQNIIWSVTNANGTSATITGNTFLATNPGVATIKATITNGVSLTQDYEQTFEITVTESHIPVTNITGIPTELTLETQIPYTFNPTVIPSSATYQSIVWTVKSQGTTGATINNQTFTATATGTAIITATIANGLAMGTPYTKDFTITVNSNFVPVTNITNVPTSTIEKQPLTLTGTVIPSNATNQTIQWTVKSAGTTGATITNNILNTTSWGTVTITATVANGLTPTTPFTKDFTIKVDSIPVGISQYNTTKLIVYPNPTTEYVMINGLERGVRIALYDVSGRIVSAMVETIGEELRVNMGHLNAGIYILRIGEQSVRIVKQ